MANTGSFLFPPPPPTHFAPHFHIKIRLHGSPPFPAPPNLLKLKHDAREGRQCLVAGRVSLCVLDDRQRRLHVTAATVVCIN